jgi:regulator of sigma E protease
MMSSVLLFFGEKGPQEALAFAVPEVVRAIGAFVLVLGVMVLLHEWGHFIVARLCGVRVDIFSIGFGPRLAGWKGGQTDYRISALPLGGYVKMAGDNPEEDRSGAPDEFLSKSRWQRALVILAGPAMNVISAAVLFFLLFATHGIPEPVFLQEPAVLAGVLKNSPAEKAGLKAGDRLLEVNHVPATTWEKVSRAIEKKGPQEKIDLMYQRAGDRLATTVPAWTRGSSLAALVGYPNDSVRLDGVAPGMAADRAGLKMDDTVVSVDGTAIVSLEQFKQAVQESGGRPLQVVVNRKGQAITLSVQPTQGPVGDGLSAWLIGVQLAPGESRYRRLPLGEAVVAASTQTYRVNEVILNNLWQLVSGSASLKQLVGPVGIARYSGEAAKRGLYDLVMFTAGISLNLAILNLLPIPIFDGGHILLLLLEAIRRRDFSIVFKERFLQVGMVFLLLLFTVVMYNDLRKLIPAKWLG